MARIAGINIPPQKHTEIGLTSIYGIGRARAKAICTAAKVGASVKIKDLSDSDMERLREHLRRFEREVTETVERTLHGSKGLSA